MSAAKALHAARAAGITVAIDGEALLLEGAAEPPQAVLDGLARYKPAILDLLRRGQCGWSPEQWRSFFDKRCRMAATSGRQPRVNAETMAFECCVAEWLNQHPAPSAPGRCAWCGNAESPGAVVLPFGTEPGTHTWLHAECWSSWHRARKTDAIAALGAMSIVAARSLQRATRWSTSDEGA
jgi:hypothetical protein